MWRDLARPPAGLGTRSRRAEGEVRQELEPARRNQPAPLAQGWRARQGSEPATPGFKARPAFQAQKQA